MDLGRKICWGVICTNKKKLEQVTLIAITLLAALLAVNVLVQTVNVDSVPQPFKSVVNVVVVFFTSAVGTVAVAFIRNLLGYARNYYRNECTETYDLNRLKETVTLYLSFVATPLALLPAPYGGIVVAVMLVADFVFSEYQKLGS